MAGVSGVVDCDCTPLQVLRPTVSPVRHGSRSPGESRRGRSTRQGCMRRGGYASSAGISCRTATGVLIGLLRRREQAERNDCRAGPTSACSFCGIGSTARVRFSASQSSSPTMVLSDASPCPGWSVWRQPSKVDSRDSSRITERTEWRVVHGVDRRICEKAAVATLCLFSLCRYSWSRFVAILASIGIFALGCCRGARLPRLLPRGLPNLHDDRRLCNGWQEFQSGGNSLLTTKSAKSHQVAGCKALRRDSL